MGRMDDGIRHEEVPQYQASAQRALLRLEQDRRTMIADLLKRTDKRDVSKRSGKALFALVARSSEMVATLAITLLAARFLLPAEYGVYAMGIIFIALTQTLTYTGFYQFVITSDAPNRMVLATSFWLIMGLAVLSSLVLALLAYPLQLLFDMPDLAAVLFWLALAHPISGFNAWASAVLLRRQEVHANFVVMFSKATISTIVGIGLLILWESLFALVAYRFARVGIGAILYIAAGARFPGLDFSKELAKKATSFSGSLYGSRFLGFLSKYAADLLLGLYYTANEVGLYRFGMRLASSATDVINQPLSNFAITQFGASARKDKKFVEPLKRFSGTIAFLTGIVGAVLIVFVEDVVTLFFNPAYLAGLVVTYAMAVRGALSVGNTLVEPVFAAVDKTKWVMTYNLVTAIVSVLAVFASTPFGLEVLAWSQVGVILFASLFAFALIKYKAGLAIGGAMRNFAVGLLVAGAYGVALYFVRYALLPQTGMDQLWMLICGMGIAGVLGLGMLLVGFRLRVFTLRAFQG